MSFSDRVNPEDALIAAQEAREREIDKPKIRAKATAHVAATLATSPVLERNFLVIALVEAAVAAMVEAFDGARAQAALGRIAARHGSPLPAPRSEVRRAAEKAFRRRR